jgi:hypothetical protein
MSRRSLRSFTVWICACLLAAASVPLTSAGEKNSPRYDERPPAHVASPVESLPPAERSTKADESSSPGSSPSGPDRPALESPDLRGEPLPRNTGEHFTRSAPARPRATSRNTAGRWVWVENDADPFHARFFIAGTNSEASFFRPFHGIRRTGGPLGPAFQGHCVLCEHNTEADLTKVCPCSDAECAGDCRAPLDPNEPACQILDVMQRVGPSVLEGSLFQEARTDDCAFGACQCPAGCQCPACDGHGRCACGTEADDRLSLIRILRRLEAQEQAQREARGFFHDPVAARASCTCPDEECEHAAATRAAIGCPDAESNLDDSIEILRETSFELEIAAHRLESENLYYRADQLREMAGQLRQEARSALAGWSAPRQRAVAKEQPLGAQRDLGLELEQLRDELRRVREALNVPSETGHPVR